MIRNRRRGFTLIELMLTVTILTITGVFVYRLWTENNLAHQDNLFRQQAAWALHSQAEMLKSRPYRDLAPTKGSPFDEELEGLMNFPGAKGLIVVETVEPGLKRITLEAAWRSARQADRKLTLTMYRYFR